MYKKGVTRPITAAKTNKFGPPFTSITKTKQDDNNGNRMPPLRDHVAREHVASPYSRRTDSQHASPALRRTAPNTPGGLFSRVKTMFSPTTWLRDANKSVDDSLIDESDSSIASLQSETAHVPSNPLDEFRSMRRQSSLKQSLYSRASSESPNAKLAKFFAIKGSEPLSEIEMEGVRALLTQSTSPVGTPNATTAFQQEDEEDSIINESMVLKPDTSANSLLTDTPSFKTTYNDSLAGDDPEISISSNTTPKRRVFDYSGFPSPYRSSRLKRSTFALDSEYGRSQKKLEEEEKKQEPSKPEKKMSNTATALLSFITSNEPEEEKKEVIEDEDRKEVDFSNPYARKKSTRSSISKKPSPLEQLEKTLQADSPLVEEKKHTVVLDKYKPVKSSSLRESVLANDDVDMDEKTEEIIPEKEKVQEKPSFGFANNAGFGSKKTEETVTKPAFNFGSETIEKPTPKSAFSFAATSASSTDTEKPAPLSSSTTTAKPFTFGTSPSSSTTTTKPAFSFNAAASIDSKDSDGDDNVEDESNLSLTIKPPQHIQPTNGHKEPLKPTVFSQFVFPGAEDLGFTIKDVDESKVSIYKGLYTF